MRKAELARETSQRTGYTIGVCDEIITECFQVMVDALAAFDEVRIQNLGVLEVCDQKGKQYYDIHSGEIKHSKDSKKIKFKPSSVVTDLINA